MCVCMCACVGTRVPSSLFFFPCRTVYHSPDPFHVFRKSSLCSCPFSLFTFVFLSGCSLKLRSRENDWIVKCQVFICPHYFLLLEFLFSFFSFLICRLAQYLSLCILSFQFVFRSEEHTSELQSR